ncbi:MAG: hypothetical protein M1816_004632 [Peltula sp. TS41687]|nr:MAG: hypothetical protein M1816_004632 [Peltula sp. TS41687]
MSVLKAVVIAGLFAQALAHGIVQDLKVNGKNTGKPSEFGWPAPQNGDGGPIFPRDYQSPDIICHKGASPAQNHIPVKGGDEVELLWRTWPTTHKGPIMTYLANCNGPCEQVDKTKLKFFKFEQTGLLQANPQRWATDQFLEQGGSWKVTIPNDIASGNYTMRHEIIAINGASNPDGAQNYPQCMNLEITAAGSSVPEGVPATALYTPQDAGILVDINKPLSDYQIPGPALYSAGNAGAQAKTPSLKAFPAGADSKSSATPAKETAEPSATGVGLDGYSSAGGATVTSKASPAVMSKAASGESASACETGAITVTAVATVTVTAAAEAASSTAEGATGSATRPATWRSQDSTQPATFQAAQCQVAFGNLLTTRSTTTPDERTREELPEEISQLEAGNRE